MEKFYKDGLQFSCTQCSGCCRHDPGYVFLSKIDLARLADHFKIHEQQFVEQYCRTVYFSGGSKRISLHEKKNYDCIFWDGGCTVYEARPQQCRSFPFWPGYLVSEKSWAKLDGECPGVNKGKLHTAEEIDNWLKVREDDPFIELD